MNPIKLWVSYEKNLKKIDKVFKENMVQDKKTGVWRNKKMAKKELEKENRLLGKRCNQLLKDKGDLIDKIADIKANCDLTIEGRDVKIMELEQKLEQTEKDLADYQFNYPKIKELEKEKSELIQKKYNLEYKIENLENKIEHYQEVIDTLQKGNTELKSELKEWKDEWQEQVQKAIDEGYARTQQTIQLTKAKEHIRTLISCLIDWVQEGDKDYCYIADAEQFIKDSEK